MMTKGKKSSTVNEDKNTEFDIVLGEQDEKDWLSMMTIKAANVINDEVTNSLPMLLMMK